jgi:hypothetical protein
MHFDKEIVGKSSLRGDQQIVVHVAHENLHAVSPPKKT